MAVRLTADELDKLGPKARAQVEQATTTDDDSGSAPSTSSKSSGGGKSTSRRRAERAGKRAAAAARRPTRSTARRLGTLFIGALGLVLAYWALTNANAAALALRAPGAALRWLTDPTRSIPYYPTLGE